METSTLDQIEKPIGRDRHDSLDKMEAIAYGVKARFEEGTGTEDNRSRFYPLALWPLLSPVSGDKSLTWGGCSWLSAMLQIKNPYTNYMNNVSTTG